MPKFNKDGDDDEEFVIREPEFTYDDDPFDGYFEQGNKAYYVDTPSGSRIPLQTQAEAEHYERIRDQYFEDNKFENISDKLELDRVLELEIRAYRYQVWSGGGKSYDGGPVDPRLDKNSIELSKEIRELKRSLGVDKHTRDLAQGEGFAEKYYNILQRAKEFGIMRNEQYSESVRILNGIFAKLTLYYNSNEEERVEFDATPEKIFEWIMDQKEIYDEIDKSFQQEQKIWIGEIN